MIKHLINKQSIWSQLNFYVLVAFRRRLERLAAVRGLLRDLRGRQVEPEPAVQQPDPRERGPGLRRAVSGLD